MDSSSHSEGRIEVPTLGTSDLFMMSLMTPTAANDLLNSTHNFENFTTDLDRDSHDYYQNSTETVQFSMAFQVIIYIIYNTVFLAALLGNILVCYVVFSSPRMRTVTNYLIANLAVGDLLMALLCVPFSYISVLLQYWPFGEVLCHLVAPAQAVCVFVSAYTLVALAGDRYVAILYPLKPRLRRSQAVFVIFLVWIVAVLTAIPIAIYTDMIVVNGNPECTEVWPNETDKLVYSLTLMVLQYFFPLAVLVFTYTRIALAVWGKKAPGEAEDARDQRLAKAKRKTVVMTLAVVAGFTLAWLPMNTMNLVLGIYPPAIENPPDFFIYLYFASHWLAMAHTTYNPFIYAWINARFRTAFTQVLIKMIKMMLTVVIVYTVSWLPFNAVVVIGDLDPSIWAWEYMTYVFPIIQWLALAHTVGNPIIYCWMNSRFRSGFRSAIENVPFWRRMQCFGSRGPRDHFSPSHRLNTYTFQCGGGGQGKLIRNSSLISNGGRTTTVNLSPSSLTALKHFPEVTRKGQNANKPLSIPLQVLTSTQPFPLTPDSPPQLVGDEELGVSNSGIVGQVQSGIKTRPRKASRHDSLLESFL